jgi:hypothetical protein
MGAMQAQDFNMAKWAVGLRLPKATVKEVEAAIDCGDIIRTHLLRPTWHFVSPENIYWMLDISAPRIRASMKGRNKQLELTEKIFSRSNRIFEKELAGGRHLTRKELLAGLGRAKIPTDNNRSSHILLNAELGGILCSGKTKGKETTYALLEERIPEKKMFHREEALAMLGKKYFESHGPATLADFVWWSGLSVSDAGRALDMIKPHFESRITDGRPYWFASSLSPAKKLGHSLHFLPAFDEFLISYKDRSAAIISEHQKRAFSNNGIFRPVVVASGRAIGIWSREFNRGKVTIHTEIFNGTRKIPEDLLRKTVRKLGHFYDQKAEVI